MRPRVGCRAALRTVRFRAHLIQYVTTISDAAGWFGDPLDSSVGITSAIALGRTLAGGALRAVSPVSGSIVDTSTSASG